MLRRLFFPKKFARVAPSATALLTVTVAALSVENCASVFSSHFFAIMDPKLVEELDQFIASSQPLHPVNHINNPDLEVVSKLQQVLTEFSGSCSSNFIRKVIRHQELCQTFDSTNLSLLNDSMSPERSEYLNGEKERQVMVDASNETVAQAFGATEKTLDKQKLAKFLEPKLQAYCRKIKQKVNLKGLELDSVLNN